MDFLGFFRYTIEDFERNCGIFRWPTFGLADWFISEISKLYLLSLLCHYLRLVHKTVNIEIWERPCHLSATASIRYFCKNEIIPMKTKLENVNNVNWSIDQVIEYYFDINLIELIEFFQIDFVSYLFIIN